jgi:hypothetical protein
MKISFQFLFILAMLCLLLAGCGGGVSSGLLLKEHPRKAAVLDFEQEGFLAGEKLGSFAADELTAALFLQKKFEVVDRAQVKAGVLTAGLSNGTAPTEEVKKLGHSLGVDYLIFGKISRLNENDFAPDKRKNLYLQIAFRLISARDGAVIGVFSRRARSKDEPRRFVSDALYLMASEVKVKR